MVQFLRKLSFYKLIPVAWTLITIILLCLPGSMIPNEQKFFIPGFDKLVHMGLFGGIVLLWAFHFIQKESFTYRRLQVIFLFTIISILLGTLLEFVQLKYIPNRDFDVYDIMADAAGALLAMGFCIWFRKN